MTCWSCIHYRPATCGEPSWCAKWKPGFPHIGVNCRAFEYEPGSDEKETLPNA